MSGVPAGRWDRSALRALLPEKLEHQWLLPIRSALLTCGKQELLRIKSKVFDDAGVQPYSTANTRDLLMHCDSSRP